MSQSNLKKLVTQGGFERINNKGLTDPMHHIKPSFRENNRKFEVVNADHEEKSSAKISSLHVLPQKLTSTHATQGDDNEVSCGVLSKA